MAVAAGWAFLFLSNIQEIGLRFNGSGGILLIDDLVIWSVPGEPDVDMGCRCPLD